MTLTACSHIDEEDRLIYVAPAEVNRAVLIEDFTGQRCINCPSANEAIAQLQQQYGEENVIAVAIHSGPYGHRTTLTSPLMPLATETGDIYYNHWGVESQPGTLINRQGGVVYDTSRYAALVNEALATPTPVALSFADVQLSADGQLTVTVEALSAENLDTKLQLWITEDNLVGMQYMLDGSHNSTYVHQHVFRTSISADVFGDAFPITSAAPATATYTVTLDDSWKREDLRLVAIVSNDTDGVLQVAAIDRLTD